MASLVPLQSEGIIVEFPDESRSGADMEWNFVQGDWRTFFRVYIQAKRLYGNGDKWTRHTYRELYHTSGKGGPLQAVVLADHARKAGPGCFPLYAFYNPRRTCELAAADGKHEVLGVNFADGYVIEALVKAATNRTLRTRNKNLRTLHPLLFALSDMFCPPTTTPPRPMARVGGVFRFVVDLDTGRGRIGITTPPGPETIRSRLAAQRERIMEILSAENEEAMEDLPPVPEIAGEVPADVQDILRRHREGMPSSDRNELNRWRVTFVSRQDDYERPVRDK